MDQQLDLNVNNGHLDKALAPVQLAGLTLKNRIIKSATFEGHTPKGEVTDGLIKFHTDIARGGTGLTTVAYCGVSDDSRTFADQMVMSESLLPRLRQLADAVHQHGGKVSGQLAHCGGFTRTRPKESFHPLGPSWRLNHYGLFSGIPFGAPMNERQMQILVNHYANSARLLKEAGFDALEIHMGHGYLLSQFISPAINKRTDNYGGSLNNRMRLPLRLLDAIRNAVGDDFPLLAKLNLSDGFRGGLQLPESIEAAKLLEQNGLNAIVMSGGFTAQTPMYLFRGKSPVKGMIAAEKNPLMKASLKFFGKRLFREFEYKELYFLDKALEMRDAVDMPLAYLGGVSSAEGIAKAMACGFDFVAMARALVKDPQFIANLHNNKTLSSDCTHCNGCVATMTAPGGVHCTLSLES